MRLPGSLHEERRVAAAMLTGPRDITVMDANGAVRSVQAADLTMPVEDLDAIWTPMHLERLARTYWTHLSRVSLGLIRVSYRETERAVVLIARPLVLLRFHAPDYELDGDRGLVRWRIRDGLLVAQRDQGHLEIEARRSLASEPGYACAHIEVEVANFYPVLSVWVARWFYVNTQSRLHVLVTYAFLRSLTRRELERSAVRRFEGAGRLRRPSLTIGDTRRTLALALGVCAATATTLIVRGRRRRRPRLLKRRSGD
jgi:hypothetical protein